MFTWFNFFHPFTFTFGSGYLKWAFYGQHVLRSCSLMQCDTLCLFICMFGPFAINVVVSMVGFKSIIKLLVPPIFYSFPAFFSIELFFFGIYNVTTLQYYTPFSPSHTLCCCCHVFYFYICHSFCFKQLVLFLRDFKMRKKGVLCFQCSSLFYVH